MTPQTILQDVCQKYGISKKDLVSKSRNPYFVKARREATFLLREKLSLTFPYIGQLLNQDHTTAIYNFRKLTNYDKPKS